MHSIQPVPPGGGLRVHQQAPQSVAFPTPPRQSDDNEPLIDLRLVGDLSRFLVNAVKRRRKIAAAVFSLFALAGIASSILLPRRYYTETKLLADRNVVMPLLGNPDRRLPNEADTPTRMAADLIMTRANLVGIIKTTDLVRQTDARRPFLGRMRKKLRTMVKGPLTPEEQVDETIWGLRTSMNIQVGDGTVVIGIVWNDPDLAFRIVQAAQQSFLEERQAQEVSLITGSIAILEKSASDVGSDINRMLDSLGRQRAQLAPEEARGFVLPRRTEAANPVASAALMSAQASLQSAMTAIADIEGFRNRRLTELRTALVEQRITYGAEHPQIESTQQLIKSLSEDSPQLIQLREDEKKFREQVVALGGSAAQAAAVLPSNADETFAAMALRNMASMRVDSIVAEKQKYGQTRLRIALAQYQQLLERLESARIELETVSATFRFKYGVLIPAAVPKDAITTKPSVLIVGSILLGALLAALTALLLDFAGRRMLESWQIERSLGLPVLGEAPLSLPSR
jgi:hypothetical protein